MLSRIKAMPEKKKLTDRKLASVKPAEKGKRLVIWDGEVPNFGVRVTDKGKRTFVLVHRFGKKSPRPREVGVYPAMTLSDARTKARGWLELLSRGIDPAAESAAAEANPQTLSDALDRFAKDHLSRRRTGESVERSLRMEFLAQRKDDNGNWATDQDLLKKGCGAWRGKALAAIDRKEIVRLVVGVHDSGRPIQANRLLSYLKKLFNFCVERGLLDASPALNVKKPSEENKRDRVLSDAEIRAVWKACDGLYAFGRAIRLLIITGQRRSEVGQMEWNELDVKKRLWTIPAARTKAGRLHVVPLSDLAIEQIGDQVTGQFVFSTGHRGDVPIAAWALAKRQLDAAITADLGQPIPAWHLHDLRHTCATGLAALGTDRITISKILNHAEGGITSRYDQHDRNDEKRRALNKWARQIGRIINPDSTVVTFAVRASQK
jgi:integrase